MKGELGVFLVVSAVASVVVPEAAAQGWGMRRLDVTLTRKLPSTLTFTGNTVKVRLDTSAQGRVPPQVAEIFRTRLTAELFKDSRIVEEKTTPDAIIETTVNDFSSATTPVQRSNFDLKTKRNVPFYNKIVTGGVTVSYRTLDGRDKRGLDSANLRFEVQQEFTPTGEPVRELFVKGKNEAFKKLPSQNEVSEYLVNGIVMQVTRRIVSVDETISVPLPRGKLEPASKLGAAARWGAMLETVEKMPPFPQAPDEAFRQYAIGIANEALAYQETDRGRSQDLLAGAALAYKKAIQAAPGEDVFQAAQNRMAGYGGSSTAVATTGESDTGASRAVSPAAGAMTNMDVIKFAREKFSEDFMIDAINAAPSVAFDMSTDSLVDLKRSGVSERVIKTMRDKAAKHEPESR
jgi:hypothetical protein